MGGHKLRGKSEGDRFALTLRPGAKVPLPPHKKGLLRQIFFSVYVEILIRSLTLH